MRFPRLRLSITDDRGDRRPVDLAGWKHCDAQFHPSTRFALQEGRAAITPGEGPETRRMWLSVILLILFVNILWSFLQANWPGIPLLAILLLALLIGQAHAWYQTRNGLQRGERRLIETMTRHALCPCCAYDLAGIDASNDGCVLCPECGAAWRSSRIVDVHRALIADDVIRPGWLGRMWGQSLRGPRRDVVTDDRGRLVRFLVRHPREWARESGDPREARLRVEASHRAVRTRTLFARVLVTVVYAAVGVGMLILAMVTFRTSGVAQGAVKLGFSAVFLLIAMAAAVAVLRGNWGIDERSAKRDMLDQGLCPTCSHDLLPVEPEDDGCRVCPACGGAWRLAGDASRTGAPPTTPAAPVHPTP